MNDFLTVHVLKGHNKPCCIEPTQLVRKLLFLLLFEQRRKRSIRHVFE